MILQSFGGHDFGADYEVWIADGSGRALPAVQAQQVERMGAWPVLSGIVRPGAQFTLYIQITGGAVTALATQLRQWFDPESEIPQALVATDDDGASNERYRMCLCEALQPWGSGQWFAEKLYVATMVIAGDVRWRAVTPDSVEWLVTVSGDTETITNDGEDEAYPTLLIEPTASGAPWRRWIPVTWRALAGQSNYPIQIGGLDTDALVTAVKMQADGSDLRVEVDGLEVDRWLYNINTADTDVWINLDFDAAVAMTLATGIAAAGAITTIVVNEDITVMPVAGILLIGSEAFTYTGKNIGAKTFTGVTREARGTTAALHAIGAAVYWIQHDVYLYYGGVAAQTADDDYKPAFELDSSDNGTWDYDGCFGNNAGTRAGGWTPALTGFYGGNHGAAADPWDEVGVSFTNTSSGITYLRNVCYISNLNVTGAEKYCTDKTRWYLLEDTICSSAIVPAWPLNIEYSIPAPANDTTWEAWTRNEAITANRAYVGISGYAPAGDTIYLEVAACTVTLNGSYTPVVSIGAESADGTLRVLAATITNNDTGESLAIAYTMAIGEVLEVNTGDKTLTYLAEDSNQRQALTLSDVRRHWLALPPGDNELEWIETVGFFDVTVTVEFEKRYYS